MLYVSEIELPAGQDPDAFADFMRDELLPAIHGGPTRVGQVEEAELLERGAGDGEVRFLWLVHFDGLEPLTPLGVRVDDAAVMERFEAFGAAFGRRVPWHEIAAWPETVH